MMTFRGSVYRVMMVASILGCSDSSAPGGTSPTHDLVFEGSMAGVPEILIREADTGDISRLFAAGMVAMDPEPSPDGTRILFVVADYVEATGDIWVINRDGSGLAQLTYDGELDDQPTWSPHGQRIAFRSFRTGREGDIWVMNADGANPVNLTPDPLPGVVNESRPAWSPDGLRIAYASNAGGNIDIWVMDADGSDPVQLTNTIDLDTEPAWSPDGATIAFRRSSEADGSDIWLVPSAGGDAVPLQLDLEQRLPVWAPAGDRIVFVQQAGLTSRPDLFSMRPDGTGRTPLVSDVVPNGSVNPAFLRRR